MWKIDELQKFFFFFFRLTYTDNGLSSSGAPNRRLRNENYIRVCESITRARD